MNRRAKQLARIRRTLDRALQSPHEPPWLGIYASHMIDDVFGTAERFMLERGWTDKAICDLVMTYARLAPPNVLAKMAQRADMQYRDIEDWDAVGFYEGRGWAPLFPSEAEARRWAS